MNSLIVNLTNCYGIKLLNEEFNFAIADNVKSIAKAYTIYAPNGVMKSSFAKTFEALSKGELPVEERYNRPTTCVVNADGSKIQKESIHVLKAEIDIKTESSAVTNILVNPEHKRRYDELLVGIDASKKKLLNRLQKSSKVPIKNIESFVLRDFDCITFADCVKEIFGMTIDFDLDIYRYATIFDPKAIEILESEEFVTRAGEFSERYQKLFEEAGSIYKKGVFNPIKADKSFSTLDKQGFFKGGHRVHLRGDAKSIDKIELDEKLREIHASIDNDETLKKLRLNLAKNVQTQELINLIENLSSDQIDFFLDRVKPANQNQFRKELWIYCFSNTVEAQAYLETYAESEEEIKLIEKAAALSAPKWNKAVELFNDRFVDMPFSLSIWNQSKAVLGKEKAKLKFTFHDGADNVEWTRQEIRTLSQGERRALYLLNFIFEVEARIIDQKETLFIIDDIADSFDYKNKHAIIQYLRDITKIDCFYQIILTHNYDFFRALTSFVHRSRCLMANRNGSSITLAVAEGVRNYFIGKWKNNVNNSDTILCATIPFARNIIEYTRDKRDGDYLKLTSLLHWKQNTSTITVGDYLKIYDKVFNVNFFSENAQPLVELLFFRAEAICNDEKLDGLNLENKVLLSIAIRLEAEKYLIERLRIDKEDPNYWCHCNNQFGFLIQEYSSIASLQEVRVLEKVSITVSSNIHLNSFMYEPILDLGIEHLVKLYKEVSNLKVANISGNS